MAPDVDAELERGCRHQRPQLAGLQPVLGFQPGAARERAVVGRHPAVGDAVVEVAGQTLGGAAALREHERRAVGLDHLRDLLQRRVPHRVAGGREEVVDRRHHLHVEVAREAGVDDDRIVRGRPGQERQRIFHRSHRGRAADALRPRAGGVRLDQRLQPFECQSQVRAALARQHRVDFIDDDEARLRQRRPEALAGEQDIERLGRGDQDVRRPPRHRLARGGQRVAGPHRHPDFRQRQAVRGRRGADAGQRLAQVLLDVVVQRAQRRHVDDVDAILQAALGAEAMEVVEGPQEGGQGLARAGRGHDQRVAAGGDRLPAFPLGPRGLGERVGEPAADEREELRHTASLYLPMARVICRRDPVRARRRRDRGGRGSRRLARSPHAGAARCRDAGARQEALPPRQTLRRRHPLRCLSPLPGARRRPAREGRHSRDPARAHGVAGRRTPVAASGSRRSTSRCAAPSSTPRCWTARAHAGAVVTEASRVTGVERTARWRRGPLRGRTRVLPAGS